MYEKILAMEKSMQAEINLLKEREMHLIACMQKDRDEIVEEKQHLEKVMSLPSLKNYPNF